MDLLIEKNSSGTSENDTEQELSGSSNSKMGGFVYVRMNTPSQLEDEYEIGSVLGEGTFGIVYRGMRKADGMKCAVKKISRVNSFSASERARLDREISILRHVKHPGIIKLLSVAESPKIIFLITELCEGNSLDYCMKQLPENTGLQEYIAAAILKQITSALSYLHNRGIVHRDLKLGNIMLLNKVELDFRNIPPVNYKSNCKQSLEHRIISFDSLNKHQQPKLEHIELRNDPCLDYDSTTRLVKATTNTTTQNKSVNTTNCIPIFSINNPPLLENNTITNHTLNLPSEIQSIQIDGVKYPPNGLQTKLIDFGLAIEVRKNEEALGNPCGTPLYMAPEVLNGRSYTRQCDLWSLGIILFILLTNQTPFSSQNEKQLINELNHFNIHKIIEKLNDYITVLCKECLIRLLTIDPAYRLTANQLLIDPWLSYYPMYNSLNNIVNNLDGSNEKDKQITLSTVHSFIDLPKNTFISTSSSNSNSYNNIITRPSSFSRFQSTDAYSTTNVLELMKQYHKELHNNCKHNV